MPHVRLTVIRPKSGRSKEALDVLREIDNLFAQQPGMVMSFVFSPGQRPDGTLGRVAIWESEDAANQMAISERGLALRSRIRSLAQDDLVETLAEVTSAHYLDAAVVS